MEISVTTVIWVLVCTALVYFMQAGFALCEAGLTRAKNTGNILMKNMMDFCIGTPCFWFIGFSEDSADSSESRICSSAAPTPQKQVSFRRRCRCGAM